MLFECEEWIFSSENDGMAKMGMYGRFEEYLENYMYRLTFTVKVLGNTVRVLS